MNLITVKPRLAPSEVRQKIEQALVRSAKLDAERITVDVRGMVGAGRPLGGDDGRAAHLHARVPHMADASLRPYAPGAMHEVPGARIVTLVRNGEMFALVLPERKVQVEAVPWGASAVAGTARCVDLETGRISQAAWRAHAGVVAVDGGLACSVPTLMAFVRSEHSTPPTRVQASRG